MKTEEKEVKIEKMVLNIDGEKVSLSMEQAKKLKAILEELFGKEIIKEVTEKYHYHDWYYRPYITYLGGSSAVPSTTYKNLCSFSNASLEVKV